LRSRLRIIRNGALGAADSTPDSDYFPSLAAGERTPGGSKELGMSARFWEIRDWKSLAVKSSFQSAKLAALCSISPRQLQRDFKKYSDATPQAWLRAMQCGFARRLIAEGCSNKEIVTILRFASQPHFCREFKKIFGVSPQSLAPDCMVALKMPVFAEAAVYGSNPAFCEDYKTPRLPLIHP
jgi:AraC-like DNA-binding protein